MALGSMDYKQKEELQHYRDYLDKIRKSTFDSEKEEKKLQQKLKEGQKSKWSGSYTDWKGWGNESPKASRKEVVETTKITAQDKDGKTYQKEIQITKTVKGESGWPEKYTFVEKEWQMKLNEKKFDEWVDEMKKQYGIGKGK